MLLKEKHDFDRINFDIRTMNFFLIRLSLKTVIMLIISFHLVILFGTTYGEKETQDDGPREEGNVI